MEPNYKFYFKNNFRPLASLCLHEAACFQCPLGYVLPLEMPDVFALYCVVEGKGLYTLNGTEHPVRSGHIFVLYPGMRVSCRADKDKPWELLTVSFDGVDARLLLNAAGFEPKKPVIKPNNYAVEQAASIMSAMYVYRGQEIYSLAQSTALLYTLMSLFIKTSGLDQTAMPPGWTGVVHFQKALDFVAQNYSRPITVHDIAAHVNLSGSRLYRVFMQQIFCSPQQYLTDYRIREACNLLEHRSGSIKEIALAVGIEDQLHFSKVFKQFTGKSPTNYMQDLVSLQGEVNQEHLARRNKREQEESGHVN
jgi:AraC-like DNA-binding protein